MQLPAPAHRKLLPATRQHGLGVNLPGDGPEGVVEHGHQLPVARKVKPKLRQRLKAEGTAKQVRLILQFRHRPSQRQLQNRLQNVKRQHVAILFVQASVVSATRATLVTPMEWFVKPRKTLPTTLLRQPKKSKEMRKSQT